MIQFSIDYSTKQHNAPKNDYRLQYRLSCVVSYITFTVNFVAYKRTICRGSPKYLQSRRQVTKFTRLNVRRPGVFNSTCPSAIAEKAKPRLGFLKNHRSEAVESMKWKLHRLHLMHLTHFIILYSSLFV